MNHSNGIARTFFHFKLSNTYMSIEQEHVCCESLDIARLDLQRHLYLHGVPSGTLITIKFSKLINSIHAIAEQSKCVAATDVFWKFVNTWHVSPNKFIYIYALFVAIDDKKETLCPFSRNLAISACTLRESHCRTIEWMSRVDDHGKILIASAHINRIHSKLWAFILPGGTGDFFSMFLVRTIKTIRKSDGWAVNETK